MVSGSEAFENQGEDSSVGESSRNNEDRDSGSASSVGTPSKVALLFSFIGAFFCATLAFIVAGHYLVGAPRSLSFFEEPQQQASQELFSQPLVVAAPGIYQRAVARDELNPALGSDFLLFVWFRLRKVPVAGESMSLLGKFDATIPNKPGYAISLEGAPDGVRPRVYWNNEQGQGRWYSFTSRPIKRKEWYLLGISYSRDTFLAAHLFQAGVEPTFTLLGGHRVEPSFAASSAADILLGAYGSSRFRGQLGPFGILKGASFERDIPEYLAAMQESPNEIPSAIPSELIQLWATPMVDRGPKAVALQTVTSPPAKKQSPSIASAKRASPKVVAPKRDKKKSSKRKSSLSGKR